jgi:hypothetical protein
MNIKINVKITAMPLTLAIPIDFDAAADSKAEFSLHHHGYNAWTLLQLELER